MCILKNNLGGMMFCQELQGLLKLMEEIL
jgi:hypothetical protein